MEKEEGLTLRAIRLAIAAAECRHAAVEHPQAGAALVAAAEAYSLQTTDLLGGIVERANRIRARLKTA